MPAAFDAAAWASATAGLLAIAADTKSSSVRPERAGETSIGGGSRVELSRSSPGWSPGESESSDAVRDTSRIGDVEPRWPASFASTVRGALWTDDGSLLTRDRSVAQPQHATSSNATTDSAFPLMWSSLTHWATDSRETVRTRTEHRLRQMAAMTLGPHGRCNRTRIRRVLPCRSAERDLPPSERVTETA